MSEALDTSLDDLEALVVGVISQTVALRREGEAAWDRSVNRLESGVAALMRHVHEMKRQARAAGPATARGVYPFPARRFERDSSGAPITARRKRDTREI